MSGNCPKCGTRIVHDFGIVSCHECGAILSIDFDGNVSLSDPDEHAAAPVAVPEPVEVDPEDPMQQPFPVDFQSVSPIEAEFHEEDSSPSSEPSVPAEPEPEPEFQENWIQQEEQTSGPPPAPTGPIDFSDVAEYANSVELDNSPLVYAFRIEGIDHKDIRKKVLDVLSDIRLNIHVKDLIPTIKGGILELHDLSPVRASIIASRLREEAVTFRWRQSVFQSEAPAVGSGT